MLKTVYPEQYLNNWYVESLFHAVTKVTVYYYEQGSSNVLCNFLSELLHSGYMK